MRNEYHRNYYQKNKEKLQKYYRNYYQKHKETIKAQRNANFKRNFRRDHYKYTNDILDKYNEIHITPTIVIKKEENLVVFFN